MTRAGRILIGCRRAALILAGVAISLVVVTVLGYHFDTAPVVIRHRMPAAFGVQKGDPALAAYRKLERHIPTVFYQDSVYHGWTGLPDHATNENLTELANAIQITAPVPLEEHSWVEIRLEKGRVSGVYTCRVPWPYSLLDY